MSRKSILLYFTIIVIFIFQCNFLLNQPPFIDEVGYAYLIKNIVTKPQIATLMLPLDNGIPPFFIFCASFVYFFIRNPILAGRLTSLILYIISIIIFHKYIQLHANKKSSIMLPLVFFALNPFIFLYSKMGILEMSVILSSLIFLYQSEITLSHNKKINIVLLAFSFILVLLSKYTGIFIAMYFLIRCLQKRKFSYFIFFALIVGILFLMLFPIMNKTFIIAGLHTNESGLFNLFRIKNNAFLISIWIKDYFSIPLLLTILYIFVRERKNHVAIATLITIISIPLSLCFTASNFFPRYLILMPLLFAIILSVAPNRLWIKWIILIIICVFYLPTDYYISSNLKKATIAKEDVWQYATDWTSGINIVGNLNLLKEGSTICVNHDDYLYFAITKESYFPIKNMHLLSTSFNKPCPSRFKTLTSKSVPSL